MVIKFVIFFRLFNLYSELFYPLCLPLLSGGGSAKKDFYLIEKTTIWHNLLPPCHAERVEAREGWGGNFIKI